MSMYGYGTLTYDGAPSIDVFPSAPPALEYILKTRATGIHFLGR